VRDSLSGIGNFRQPPFWNALCLRLGHMNCSCGSVSVRNPYQPSPWMCWRPNSLKIHRSLSSINCMMRHNAIATRMSAGHVVTVTSARQPDASFAAKEPDLEDVYFSALPHLSSGQFGLNDSLY
jgi:hypothetical protein